MTGLNDKIKVSIFYSDNRTGYMRLLAGNQSANQCKDTWEKNKYKEHHYRSKNEGDKITKLMPPNVTAQDMLTQSENSGEWLSCSYLHTI